VSPFRQRVSRVLLRAFGRPIACATCGRTLFTGIALVWRGEVRLIGAETNTVRVRFGTKNTLQFRHVHLDTCRSPDRPWVS